MTSKDQSASSQQVDSGPTESNGELDMSFVPEGHPEYEALVQRQLQLLGEDPEREGLARTPKRVADSMAWLTRGYQLSPAAVVGEALFDSEGARNMVMVRDIELYSLCEHHMLPFFG